MNPPDSASTVVAYDASCDFAVNRFGAVKVNLRLEFRPLTGAADRKDNFGLNGFANLLAVGFTGSPSARLRQSMNLPSRA